MLSRSTFRPNAAHRASNRAPYGISVLSLLFAATAALLTGCSSKDAPPAAAATEQAPITNRLDIPEQVRRNLGITFAKVENRRVAATLRMPGRFELMPQARREYRVPLAGKVEILVNQYDNVTTGTPLYRLDSRDWRTLQQEIASAEASARSTSASLVQARIARKGGVGAQDAVARRLSADKEHVAALRAAFDNAVERVAQLERVQQAVGGQASEISAAKARMTDARTALAEAEEESAELQKAYLLQKTDTSTAFSASDSLDAQYEAKRAEHDAALLLLRSARNTARSVLAVTEAEFDAPVDTPDGPRPLWQTVDQVEIRALGSGVVQTIAATNGTNAEQGQLLLTVADPEQVRFRAVALQSDLSKLRDGMNARIAAPVSSSAATSEESAPENSQSLDATISLGQEANPDQRTLDVIATPRAVAAWARAGLSAYLEVVLDETEDPEPAIPVAAVLQDELQKVYFRRDPENPDKAIRVEADLGVSDGMWVVVASGVKVGDEVVVGGAYQLKLAGGGKSSEAGHFHADGTFHAGKH